ncbi:MAG TPA: class I SAM-dependent methyltransferase [Candidatus Acidoferrum sp.]|nr:class I SAM-dependent methyltransferase [Candidatus Acidoferrum sp.]
MLQFPAIMTTTDSTLHYALGSTDAEHERLIRQAARLAPFTERFFRDAGIGPGQRVLDIGSGAGDVAMLAANLVGPSGEVVGIERDPHSIARARSRVAEAGLHNVIFTQSDVSQIPSSKPFDAVVGRFILMFLPDPLAILRSLTQLVRPGGVVAFHELSWAPYLLYAARLPLWSAGASLVHETFRRSGANTEMGFALFQIFQQAGLPAPTMSLEMPLGHDPEFTRWVPDVLGSLLPLVRQFNLPLEPLGDLDTLPERLQAEVAKSNSVVTWMALVGAWSRRPIT